MHLIFHQEQSVLRESHTKSKTTGTSAGLTGTPNITVGSIIASTGTFSNVTIGGTLTYEDVTNIDSVGLVTQDLV